MKRKTFTKKAFTLIELLIVIAIIGILFIVLVSKVDFATDKAKATGVQTDFRSFQLAFDTVAKENAGFNTFGWDTGDLNQDGKRNSYDEGDNGAGGGVANNGIQDGTEVFTGHKVYAETFTKVYSLKKAKADGTLETNYDRNALNRLETAINANLDPKLHITIKDDGEIVMANGAKDPWNKEYHGYYITNAETDGQDRGAIILYSDGANNTFGSEHTIANGVVTVTNPGSSKDGKDDYSIVSCYTYVNGYGEVLNMTTGFSNNQSFLAGGNNLGVGNVTNDNTQQEPNEEDENLTNPTYDPIELMKDEFKMVDGSGMNFTISEEAITLYMNGEVVGEIPPACFTIENNNVYVSGTNQYDGTFTICEDGYVELNGNIVAKAKKAWVSVAPGEYLIIHNNAVYNSQDGNSIEYKYGNVDELVYYLEAFKQTTAASLFALSGYNISSYNGTLTVENCFDVLTVIELGENPRFPYGYNCDGLYAYYGGSAIDSKTMNSKIKTAFWQANDVKMEQITKIYRLGNGKSLMNLNDELADGLYLLDKKETYYHDDQATENIMFFEDYALYFEPGMTYRQWMHKTFLNTIVLNDFADTAQYDVYGVYIAEEYLDTLCEAGYNNKLQGGTRKEHHSQLGFWQASSGIFSWEYVYYSYGKATIFHVDMNKDGYEDLGSAWAGGLQTENTIFMEDFYNYFSKHGTNTILGRGFAAAFRPTTNNVVDISSFVSIQNGKLIVDTTSLQSVYGISQNTEYMPIVQYDGYYLDCTRFNMSGVEYIRPIYTFANNQTIDLATLDIEATGITFYYNGVVYTGFAR